MFASVRSELRPERLKMGTQTLVGSTYFLARRLAVQLTFIVLHVVAVLPGKKSS